jgi:glutamyl-tRNA synthetase
MILTSSSRAWQCPFLLAAYARHFSGTSACCIKNNNLTSKLPSTPARTRFAPSPTGYLHLGSLRTALFNYLLAKKTGGQFLLRIEDTDTRRTVPGALERLCSDLQWAGLQWDEGPQVEGPYGPYVQSKRTPLYHEHAHKLLDTGHAYRCFCSVERLDDLARRRKELGLPTDYDRQCAGIPKDQSDERAAKGDSHVIRLLAPDVYPEVTDLIYGRIGRGKPGSGAVGVMHKHGEITYEDPVLLKSDGKPTYHLANVVDDHHMKITHVVRATEWISSTPKHLALYDAFGWTAPSFAHVGLLVDEAGHKLSKRNFDTDIAHFRNDLGVLPSALTNFVALLGWSHGRKSDLMELEELVKEFEMRFTKGNTTVSLEKMWFLQRGHAGRVAAVVAKHECGAQEIAAAENDGKDRILERSQAEFQDMTKRVLEVVSDAGHGSTPSGLALDEYVTRLLMLDAKSYSKPAAFLQGNIYFFTTPTWSTFANPSVNVASSVDLRHAAGTLMAVSLDKWNADTLGAKMKQIVAGESERLGVDNKAYNKLFAGYMRWILLDGMHGPGIAAAMELLGRGTCLQRLDLSGKVKES